MMYAKQPGGFNHAVSQDAATGRGWGDYQKGPDLAGDPSGARQLEIPHQMERLERTLTGCMQGLDVLNDRLSSSVLVNEPTTDTKPRGSEVAVSRSKLGSQIQQLTGVAAAINERIQAMVARLEA